MLVLAAPTSYHLHILVCWLHKQEQDRGCIAQYGELWVEQGIQRVKNIGNHLSTGCLEEALLMSTW